MCNVTELIKEFKIFVEEVRETAKKAEETGESQCFDYGGEKIQVSFDELVLIN